ncbi:MULTISPECIES: hypothetical protein [Klebsiella]|nr:hypothetical protein [Klebsiella michiganensis]MCZ0065086.1 hypothetical protein [Klebsiella michiganensis]MCZ0081085.1 hypothetical protein [Klebsiella michiganensis]WAT39983.1 hypothetical protein OEE44_27185 [Klebsiella michiganensis]WAX84775.1 hypothetical protein F0A14_028015 [Klebsiella michiganensis]HDX8870176.1 hypothetical protein [Klebsiella michiganensis]
MANVAGTLIKIHQKETVEHLIYHGLLTYFLKISRRNNMQSFVMVKDGLWYFGEFSVVRYENNANNTLNWNYRVSYRPSGDLLGDFSSLEASIAFIETLPNSPLYDESDHSAEAGFISAANAVIQTYKIRQRYSEFKEEPEADWCRQQLMAIADAAAYCAMADPSSAIRNGAEYWKSSGKMPGKFRCWL